MQIVCRSAHAASLIRRRPVVGRFRSIGRLRCL